MSDAIRRAMSGEGEPPRWLEVLAAFVTVASSPLSEEGRRLLLDVLAFEGRLHVACDGDGPHRAGPEKMLRSLAAQALARNHPPNTPGGA